jgi:hypothetical protein
MASRSRHSAGARALDEMKEFAAFPAAAQRYIRRSLDVGFHRTDAMEIWSREADERVSIQKQLVCYAALAEVRAHIPEDLGLGADPLFFGALVRLSEFDLAQGPLTSFAAYRFLYERLLGATIRPWLSAAFCAAASLPSLHPSLRRMLLKSMSEADATASAWSAREPSFYPEWVEKDELTVK